MRSPTITSMSATELMTVKQVARELGVANTRVTSLIRQGHIVAVSMPAGPGTWRVAREAVDAYVAAKQLEAKNLRQRRRRRQLEALRDAWERVPADERERLCADLPADIVRPLLMVVDNPTSGGVDKCVALLSHAYRCRTDAGIQELALRLPQDLFWAIARIA